MTHQLLTTHSSQRHEQGGQIQQEVGVFRAGGIEDEAGHPGLERHGQTRQTNEKEAGFQAAPLLPLQIPKAVEGAENHIKGIAEGTLLLFLGMGLAVLLHEDIQSEEGHRQNNQDNAADGEIPVDEIPAVELKRLGIVAWILGPLEILHGQLHIPLPVGDFAISCSTTGLFSLKPRTFSQVSFSFS